MEQQVHELKILPHFFLEVATGIKKYEVRKNDRNFQVNDILILKEYSHLHKLTGNYIVVKVTHILHGGEFGIEDDYCILSIKTMSSVSKTHEPEAQS